MAYNRPGIKVYQQYAVPPVPVVPDQYCCLIGPSYKDYDYANNKSEIEVGEYDNSVDGVYTVYNPSNETLVPEYLAVTLETILLRYFSHTAGTTFRLKSALEPNKIEAVGGFYFGNYTNVNGSVYTRDASLINRDAKVGDYVYASRGLNYARARITELENEVIAASIGILTVDAGNLTKAVQTPDALGNPLNVNDPGVPGDLLPMTPLAATYNGDITANPAILEDEYTIYLTTQGTTDPTSAFGYAIGKSTGGNPDLWGALGVGFDVTYGYTNPSSVEEYYSMVITGHTPGAPGSYTYEIYGAGDSTSAYKDSGRFISQGTFSDAGPTTIAIEHGLELTTNAPPGAPANWVDEWQKIEIASAETRFMVESVYGDDQTNIVFPGLVVGVSYAIPIGANGQEVTIGTGPKPCPATSAGWTPYDSNLKSTTWMSKVGSVTDARMQYDAVTGTSAGTFTGTRDMSFSVECIKGGYFNNAVAPPAVAPIYLKIRSTDGTFNNTITAGFDHTTAVSIGYGTTINFVNNTQQGIGTGDVFYVDCTAAGKGGYAFIKTDTDLTALGTGAADWLNIDMFIYKASYEVGQKREENESLDAWTYDTSTKELTLEDNLYLSDSTWTDALGNVDPIPVITEFAGITNFRPTVYIGSRYVDISQNGAINVISDTDEADLYYGTDSVDNVLRHAIGKCLTNSLGTPIKALSISADTEAGYTAAINVLAKDDTVYHLVPMSTNIDIFTLFETHVNTMSSADNKKFRIMFFSRELITFEYLFDQYFDPTSGVVKDYTASITADPAAPTEFTIVTMDPGGSPDLTLGVSADDKVEYNFSLLNDEWTYDEYEVEEVLTKYTLRLKTGPSAAVASFNKVRIKSLYTPSQTATQMKEWAENTDNKRVVNVVLSGLTEDSVSVEPYFATAALAGLKSAYPSHKPLTNASLDGFDRVYTRDYFSEANLDTIAEGGNLIITQDTPTTNIFIRHQLTTRMATLDERELSLVSVLDLYTVALWTVQKPYIGGYNVSPQLLDRLRYLIDQIGDLFMHEKFGILGPYIKSYAIATLAQNQIYADKVDEEISVDLPEPFNNLDIFINVI